MNIKIGVFLCLLGFFALSQDFIQLTESTSLQELIDKVASETTILLPAGKWRETIVIRKSLVLQSIEPRNTLLGQIIIEGEGEIKVKLIGLKVSAPEGSGIIIKGGIVEILNSSIENNKSAGVWLEKSAQIKIENSIFTKNGYGVFDKDGTKVLILSSSFQSNKFGMRISDFATIFISESIFSENEFSGISAHDLSKVFIENSVFALNQNCGICAFDSVEITVFNSRIEKNKKDGIYLDERVKAIISSNSIWKNQGFGIFSRSIYEIQGEKNIIEENLLELAGNLSAKLRIPLLSQTKEKEIIFPGKFATLQEAIDALAPGGTIFFLPGTYKVNGVIWKPLTLRGTAPEETTIEGVISLIKEATNVKIEGIRFLNSWDSGIIIGSNSSVEIENVIIQASRLHGVFVLGNSQISFLNVRITGNVYGLAVFQNGKVFVQNSIFEKNGYGICIFGLGEVEILNSKCQTNEVDGIYIHDFARVLIKDSLIQENQGNGISIFGESQVLILGSKIKKNGGRILTRERGHGILISQSPNIILENNEISYNKYYGIYLNSEFSGKICGKRNQIFWNKWGKTRPFLLFEFLKEGKCYPGE